MDTPEDPPPISALLEKISGLEKRLAQLELKDGPLTTESLSQKDQQGEDKETESTPDSPATENAANEEKEESFDPRVKIVIRRKDETGQDEEKKEDFKSSSKDKENEGVAFTLRKFVYSANLRNPEENDSEIDILNPDLWDLLKEHLGHYPYHIFHNTPKTLYSPFEYIVFSWKDLQAACGKQPDDNDKKQLAREDLKRLLRVVSDGRSGDAKLDRYFKSKPSYNKQDSEVKQDSEAKKDSEANQDPETISFIDLWTIFPPGTLVFGKPFQSQEQVFVVRDNQYAWPRKDPHRRGGKDYLPWKLDAWSYDWVDGGFKRAELSLPFPHFDGSLPLTSLPYYPLHAHAPDKRKQIEERLIERGKRFRKVCESKEDGRLFQYDGKAFAEHKGLTGLKNDEEADQISDFRSSVRGMPPIRRLESNHNPGSSTSKTKSETFSTRVMVDYDSYAQYCPSEARIGPLELYWVDVCTCVECQNNEGLQNRYRAYLDDENSSKAKDWKDEQYMLCAPRVLGYLLQDKRWAQLQVSELRDIDTPTEENIKKWFSRLQLADDNYKPKTNMNKASDETKERKKVKNMLLSLIKSHRPGTTEGEGTDELEVNDIIPKKGKGLIILLYGPPGVGKTSTAETMALGSRKPLLSISVADVGTDAKNVESNLSRIFSLAARWKAILLLDEADVFLENRSTGNKSQPADKNALVSVFLRVLEYYHGIMFLTTNQIASFDVAIPSRVHVAIQYKTLSENQTLAIFKGFLEELDQTVVEEREDLIYEWAGETILKSKFDGRQIRNMVTVALGLARAERDRDGKEKGMLQQNHLQIAYQNLADFQNSFETQMQRYKEGQSNMIK